MVPKFGVKHWLHRPSAWICFIGVALSAVPISELGKTFYHESIIAQSTLVFFVLAPAVSAAMAWESSRFRSIAQLGRKSVVRVYINRIFAWSLIFPAGYLLANISQSTNIDLFSSLSSWLVLAYSFIVGICWTLIGSALGFSFKPLISVCVAAVFAYAWYAVVPSTSPGLLRHMTGDFLACCSLDSTLDLKAIGTAAVAIVGISLIMVGAAALFRHRSKLYISILALGLLSLTGSIALSQQLTEFGLAQRDPYQIVCSPKVCVWPEVPVENISLNVRARDAFTKISPTEWKRFSENPVMWGEFSQEHLSLSSQPTLEGVVGEFVDQAGSAELTRLNAKICGVPARDIGAVLSGLPWDPNRPVTLEDVVRRIEQSTCGVGS